MYLHNAPALKIPGVLRNRDYRLLFSARIISQLGDQIYVFAISWYILNVTHSSLQGAVPLILTTVITTFISLFGGTIADRLDRKHILVRTDILQGCILLVMVFLIYQNWLQLWMIYIFTVILAFCSSVFSPAASAIIPDIVPKKQLMEATSANQFAVSFCTMAGMLAGGVLYTLFGMTTVLVFNVASNLISAAMESRLNIPLKVREKPKFSLKKKDIHPRAFPWLPVCERT